jgi:hypothetical protein
MGILQTLTAHFRSIGSAASHARAGCLLAGLLFTLPAAARAEIGYGLTEATNQIVVFSTDTPGTLIDTLNVTGLNPGELLVSIDIRPKTAQLYGVGVSGRIYVINPHTGQATVVGTGPWSTLPGMTFGADFDPVADRLRVVTTTDDNISFNPDTGEMTILPQLQLNPTIAEIAGKTRFGDEMHLFGIDTASDSLVEIYPPDSGGISPLSPLGFNSHARTASHVPLSGEGST